MKPASGCTNTHDIRTATDSLIVRLGPVEIQIPLSQAL